MLANRFMCTYMVSNLLCIYCNVHYELHGGDGGTGGGGDGDGHNE